jgi:hypothetical protein
MQKSNTTLNYNVSTLTTEAECPSETPRAIDKASWCQNEEERIVNIPSCKKNLKTCNWHFSS